MKHTFYLIGLLLGLLCFAPEEDHQEQDNQQVAAQETCMQETATSDMERKIEVLSEELQHSQGLLARRSFQTNGQSLTLRNMKTVEKILHETAIQQANQLHRLSQHRNLTYISHLSSLACREGQQLFALRKLLL
ncbi:MAG: hypothetical protein ACI3ZY_06285 [Parabacteroides sp.]